MEEQSAIGSDGLKKDRSQAQDGDVAHLPQQHGANGVLPNGIPGTESAHPIANGESGVAMSGMEDAPALDQSWRGHDNNKKLGVLIDRLAQSCYKGLTSTLSQMSEIRIQQQQPNGIVPHASEDASSGSLQKKRLLMDFAKEQRDRFIKTLVLTEWCKNEEDVAKLIDLKVWQDSQGQAQARASWAIKQMIANMRPAKVPSPNIEDAMELLATSKVSAVPDLGYLPPKRLTAKQLLKTLRNMNVTLATRLNLHEDLPLHFQNFSIADGRATFTVEGEFEVDLSVADEDPATPFYFIDIRLLFTPASDTLDERLRGYMEAKVNQELSTKGLQGCYDFLHNFVVTHKINVLHSQAEEMVRQKWFDCLKTEHHRRNFILQYWTGMPGPKSWIEFGVSSGKSQALRSSHRGTSKISVRWFRNNVEMKNEPFDFDWRHVSLEKCVSQVISKHAEWTLTNLRDRIHDLAGANSGTSAEIGHSDSEAEMTVLSLRRSSLRNPLKVRIEPVTGQFFISPASRRTAEAERRLNSDPSSDSAKLLLWLICVTVQERVRKQTELLGWESTPKLSKQDNLQKVFGEAVRHISVYTPSRAWGDHWALAITVDLSGERYWTVSLSEKRNEQDGTTTKSITSARRIQTRVASLEENAASRMSLMRIKRLAVVEVAFSTLAKQLKDMRIPYSLEHGTTKLDAEQAADSSMSPTTAMFIRFSNLMKSPPKKATKPWASEIIRLTHHGITSDSDDVEGSEANIRHDLRLTLESGSMKSLQQHLSQSKDRNLMNNSSGGLALRFVTPFGEPFVEQIKRRLQTVERLDRAVAALKKRSWKCTQLGLSRIAFVYNQTPELSAQLDFSNDGSLPARLKLLPPNMNPQKPIRVSLEKGFNADAKHGFDQLVFLLQFTLPVWQALEHIETSNPGDQRLAVHHRSSIYYSLKYSSPAPACEFAVRMREKPEADGKSFRWFIEKPRSPESDSKQDDSVARYAGLPDEFVKILIKLWRTKGDHWQGVGNGVVADSRGVGAALTQLDQTVRQFDASAANTTVVVKNEPDIIMID